MNARSVLECGGPPPLWNQGQSPCSVIDSRSSLSFGREESARGLAHSKTWRPRAAVLLIATAPLSGLAGETFTDDFALGLDPVSWTVVSNVTLYTVDTSTGAVRITKPTGGSYSFQYAGLQFRPQLRGDFDAQVDFRDASINRLDGTPGNQVSFNLALGGQFFALTRSDETGAGHNVHLYRDPPRDWVGTQSTVATAGRLRVTRTGPRVRAYLNSTLLHEADYNTNTATISFTLQNNGTRDATAVTFDDFAVTAAELVRPPARFAVDWFTVDGGGGESADGRFNITGTIGQPDAGGPLTNAQYSITGGFWALPILLQTPGAPTLFITNAAPGFATIWWTPPTPGFVLQERPGLLPVAWTDSPSGATNPIVIPTTLPQKLYRLRKP